MSEPDQTRADETAPETRGEAPPTQFIKPETTLDSLETRFSPQIDSAATRRPSHAPTWRGASIGDFPGYELLQLLGEGGMGVVWKARQVHLNRVVALKMVLGEHRVGAKELIRFLAEAEAVASVKHPHVVHVHEYGDAAGRPFLAMEYLPAVRGDHHRLFDSPAARPAWEE